MWKVARWADEAGPCRNLEPWVDMYGMIALGQATTRAMEFPGECLVPHEIDELVWNSEASPTTRNSPRSWANKNRP